MLRNPVERVLRCLWAVGLRIVVVLTCGSIDFSAILAD